MQKKKVSIVLLLTGLSFLALLNVPPVMASPGTDVLIYGDDEPQNEVSIAVNPTNSSNVVVGFNDHTPGRWVASYAYSIDGGDTWTYGGQLPDVNGTLTGEPFCDPWLAFDSGGYLYYTALSGVSPFYLDNHEVFVSVAAPDAAGMVGPLGFGDPQIVEAGTGLNDKPVIAVDRTGGTYDGNVYVVWCHRPSGVTSGYRIWFRRGRRTPGTTTMTWDPPRQVGPNNFTQKAQVRVGPRGEVYVAYQRQTSQNLTDADAQLFSYSTDGGDRFTDVFVSSVTPVNRYLIPNEWARHTCAPTLGVSPTTGTIFIAWADRRNGDDDILLSRSTTGGRSWRAPKRVNRDLLGNGRDQWHPELTVNSRGYLDIIFYDRRDDPGNELTMLYAARSTDDGVSFVNWAISDTGTNPDAFLWWASGSLGDYVGIDSVGFTTYVSWGDGRNGDPGPPRDHNSDVYFDKWSEIARTARPALFPSRVHLISPIPSTIAPIEMSMRVRPIEGFKDIVKLSAENVPPGTYYDFEPASGVPPFETTFTITDKNAKEGTYEVRITASYNDEILTLPIEVVITSTPYILLETTTTRPGDTITLEGHGFTPDSLFEVFLTINSPELLKTGEADGNGVIDTEITIPDDTPIGTFHILVKDKAGIEASATLHTPPKELEEEQGGILPAILILSPENKTYPVNNVPLSFVVNESTSWIGYSLDGQMNVTITGNTTLVGLSDGSHSITVYANDTAGNMGYFDTVFFTVDTTPIDITPPSISIISPENKTYDTTDIPLTFTVDEPTSWIGYSLAGELNVTITGDTTLSKLPDGSHNLIVYAKDTAGNTGTSETIYFTIETQT